MIQGFRSEFLLERILHSKYDKQCRRLPEMAASVTGTITIDLCV
jgi:hypothetical protein